MRIKSHLIYSSLIFLTLIPVETSAAPAYGTKLPGQWQFQIGAQSYTVFERKLYRDQGEIRSQQQFLNISLGFTDWFTLDLKGGSGDIEQKPDIGNAIKYETYVGGGYGFRLKFLDTEKTDAVFGFQHISIHPVTQIIDGVKHKAVLDDWNWSFLVGHRLGMVEPYAGVRWSRMDYIHWVDNERKRVKSDLDRSTGAILGFNIFLKEDFWLNVEGNAFDTEALAAGFNYQF